MKFALRLKMKKTSDIIDITNKISEFYTWYFKKYFKLITQQK